ncbi:hypothetical protein [Brachybacterium saurashtrense]|uniref:Uncharacterized protein n=1 Tax=Brachybacterium saurashtrense TaxID=556288 RepID=A0A345YP63_9MICO|nr:hypothetical protein [Brachybacterium saurashtrense]AXK45715.1 hypothetical protein DWV08_08910 [Brachybacterium saurashtrense]RRR24733.1 hypothetical protein DXU92_00655 [Brachybacterium saurashtrense]
MVDRRPGFHSTFRGVGDRGDFSPAAWEQSFRPTASSLWENDGGGSISHADEGGERRVLILEFVDGLVSIAYDDAERYWVAAPSGGLASEFVVSGNGATVPAGSGFALGTAWAIVEQFLRAPRRRPSASWVDADTLEWPDDY